MHLSHTIGLFHGVASSIACSIITMSRCAKTCFKAWCFSLAAVGGEKNIKKIAGHVQGVFVIYINMPLSFLDVYVSISYLWNISGEHYDLTVLCNI